MIWKINIAVGHEILDMDVFTEKLIVDTKKKQLAIIRKSKTIAGFFKCIV